MKNQIKANKIFRGYIVKKIDFLSDYVKKVDDEEVKERVHDGIELMKDILFDIDEQLKDWEEAEVTDFDLYDYEPETEGEKIANLFTSYVAAMVKGSADDETQEVYSFALCMTAEELKEYHKKDEKINYYEKVSELNQKFFPVKSYDLD